MFNYKIIYIYIYIYIYIKFISIYKGKMHETTEYHFPLVYDTQQIRCSSEIQGRVCTIVHKIRFNLSCLLY